LGKGISVGWGSFGRVRVARIAVVASLTFTGAYGTAQAAGGGFFVDNAGVDDPGSCKVEAWASAARNGDRVFAVAPACAVSLGQPVEFGVQYDRVRFDGQWASAGAIKAKTSLVPFHDNARFGAAISGSAIMSFATSEIVAYVLNVPVSFHVTDQLHLNVQAGGLWERNTGHEHLTWGAGIELMLTPQFTFIGEIFSFASEHRGAQAGLRYTPHEKIDFDLIYGHNLAGEKSNWITLGMNVRF
jgi:hypothetical protein